MRQIIPTIALLMAACAAIPPGDARSPEERLDRRIIERIETSLALAEDLANVGVQDSAEMNRNARVRVRSLNCSPPDGAGVVCSYEASRCLDGENDADGDGWCRRTQRFLRRPGRADQLGTSNGWSTDRPDP